MQAMERLHQKLLHFDYLCPHASLPCCALWKACLHLTVQPSSQAELRLALELLASEVQQHADIVIVPGGWEEERV